MRYRNSFRPIRFLVVLLLIAAGAVVCGAADQAAHDMAAKCTADLAQRLKLPVTEITVKSTQATTWPDTALGMPEIDVMYAQVITPGWKIILEARHRQYLYTASTKTFRFGGPVELWACSMLYTRSTPNEPNLNRDLFQCSLLGTNSVHIASGVAEYYPQANGAIIFKQRTSRSGHDLLLVNAAKPGKTKHLYSAFDFGAAALNGAQNTWAAYVRPTLGLVWQVAVAPVNAEGVTAKARLLNLPEDVRPGQIAWSDDKLMILVTKGDRSGCFETDPKAENPVWTPALTINFPGIPQMMLNKSESLEITQHTENGKPSVAVERIWFNGDRIPVATLNGLTLGGYDFCGAGYIFIWGNEAEKPASYAVDYRTGEVIPGFHGPGDDIKLFRYAPISKP